VGDLHLFSYVLAGANVQSFASKPNITAVSFSEEYEISIETIG
jgi:hypothetical protein